MSNASTGFWNFMARNYAKNPVADPAAYEKKLEKTQQYFRPDMQVLEIGCGTGTTALHHAPRVEHILATDASSNMIDIARDKAQRQGCTNVEFRVAAIDDLEIADQSMDMVMAHSILHLVDDKDAVIAKAQRWLKPGGIFVSSTACMAGSMKVMRPVLALGRMLRVLPLVRFFSEEELVKSITNAGFAVDFQWRPTEKSAVFIVAIKS